MFIKQLSIFVENKSGKIADILNVLGENNIDISALSIADTTDFGIVRLIVNDVERAASVLREYGAVVKVTDVIGVSVNDAPGGLARVLNILKDAEIELDYIYAFVGRSGKNASVVMKTDDTDKTLKCLEGAGINTITSADVYGD